MTKEMKEWYNYGDVNFMEYGGCLVREAEFKDCFEVIWLATEIPDYKGKYKNPMIVARCYIDLGLWLRMNDDEMKSFNKYSGYGEDYVPYTLEEKMYYSADLISYYGIQEFEPKFPEETGCGPYGFTLDKVIVGKTITQRFLKEYDVPAKFRR